MSEVGANYDRPGDLFPRCESCLHLYGCLRERCDSCTNTNLCHGCASKARAANS